MDRKIRLVKGMSYHGHGLKVKKTDPEVVTDEATAKKAVASGFFEYVPDFADHEVESEGTGEVMQESETAFAGEFVLEGEPIEDAPGELTTAEEVDSMDVTEMSFEQLKALAAQMGISTKGLKSKASLISAIESEAELSSAAYGV